MAGVTVVIKSGPAYGFGDYGKYPYGEGSGNFSEATFSLGEVS